MNRDVLPNISSDTLPDSGKSNLIETFDISFLIARESSKLKFKSPTGKYAMDYLCVKVKCMPHNYRQL